MHPSRTLRANADVTDEEAEARGDGAGDGVPEDLS